MKRIYLSLVAVLLTFSMMAQTASVQVIHNSPTPGTDSGPIVDIYVNGALLEALTAVPFRGATPFLDVPAGTDIEVAVAVNPSNDVNDAIATFDLGQLTDGGTYIVIANGIVGDGANPFDLAVTDMARSSATDEAQVDLITFHGSPGAPAVDVDVRGVGNVISDLSFGNFTDYLSVAPGEYYLDIRPAGVPAILNTYKADLSGVEGQSVTLVASGLLIGEPGFSALAVLADGTVLPLEASPVANVQVIHNAIGADTVDIYAGDELLLDDFAFRTATPFTFLPAGVDITLGVAASNSTSSADAIATFDVNLTNGSEYLVIANGILGDAANPFGLAITDMARSSATDASQVDLITFHGSPGAPAVDVDVRGVGNVISDLSFGNFTDYLSVAPGEYYLDIRPAGVPAILNTYKADLSGVEGQSVTLVASGLLIGEPGFSALAVLADGTVLPLEASPVANVQVIHNAIGADTVDIYAGDELLLDDFAFRTATPFTFLPAGVDITLGVAASNSTSSADAIATFDVNLTNGSEYLVIANGILGDAANPFGLAITDMARSSATDASQVDLITFHGSPGAPAVDVDVRGVGNVISDLSFGNFTDYLSVAPGEYYLDIRPAGVPAILNTYKADLSGVEGQSVTLVASGLLIGEPGFSALAVLADGTVLPLEASPVANVQVIHNAIEADTVDIYAGDELLLDDFAFRTATPFTFLPAGVDITLGVAASNSTSSADAIATFDVNLTNGSEYLVIANGILGDAANPFGLAITDMARSSATDASQVDLITFHGSPGAPAVDVDVRGVGNVISDLSFGNFTDYLSVAPGEYYLDIRPAGVPAILNTYKADLSGVEGQSVTLVASGLLIGEPGFSALAVLADGTVLPLEASPVANVQVIHNAIGADTVDIYAGDELLLDDFAFRTATPFTFLPAGVDITLGVAASNSTSSADAIATFDVNLTNGSEYLVIANGILGDAANPFGLAITDMARSSATDASQVDLITFHGSPGAPAVDVDVRGVGNVISDLSFGNFTDYLSVAPGEYYLDIRPAGVPAILNTYKADLSGVEGQSVTLVASGLLIGEPGFSALAVLADGTVLPLEASPVANVQVIHNAIGADTVDIYAGDELLLDDFAFRTATPFTFLPAGVDITLGVAASNSTSSADAIATFDVNLTNGSEYLVIANGILGDAANPFGLAITDMARSSATDASQVDLITFHGSPGAPAVDVDVRGVGNVISDLSFGNFTDYLSVAPGEYFLDIRPAGVPAILNTYKADLSGVEGQSVTLVASGLLIGEPGLCIPYSDTVYFPSRRRRYQIGCSARELHFSGRYAYWF
jgi:hypothetical protein